MARDAGELTHSISLAMVAGIGLQKLASLVQAYPTQGVAIRQAVDAYVQSCLTPSRGTLEGR
ncbi:hypothetical protein BH11PSE7_BH11PSE7_28620 [soil metagenome]